MPEQKSVELLTAGQMYPTGLEFGILLLVMLQLLLGGYLLKAVLIDKYQIVPIKWGAAMLLAAVLVLGAQTSLFRQAAEQERILVVLWWCFAFALPTMWFYIKTFVDALSEQSTQRLSPMGTKIEEAGEFSAARKLAQKGDIDGAVILYRGYRDNRSGALLEAARLLRKEERYAEALSMFQEISERYPENKPIWAEATYNLAKIMETNLNQPIGAMQYYHQICTRTPETKSAQMASSDLSRLQVMTGQRVGEMEGVSEDQLAGHPDISKIHFPLKYNRENMTQDLLDSPIPERDPFMTRDIYTVRGAKPPKVEEPAHKAVVRKAAKKKSPATRKKLATKPKPKPATASKAAAKKTTSAKKKAAAKKAPAKIVAAKPKAKPKPKASTARKKAVPKAKTSTLAKKKAAAKKKPNPKPAPKAAK